ncbi:hypothetical protein GCM10019059_03110 [Camelimonas fluminis]|nr:hypothetical protein GCM10019059_03110 [Camelimonas fluminis]
MIFVGGGFSRSVALALLGHHMHQDRAIFGVTHILQHRQQVLQIVAVDRADVEEAQFLEQGAAGQHAAGVLLGALGVAVEETRQLAGELLADFAQGAVGAP